MTSKLFIGNRRFFWPLEDMDLTFTEISATMRDIARNFRMLETGSKFVFMPDPGLDLIRLNKIPHPVPWRELIVQEELEEHLSLLHLYTRALNSYMGSLTPWTLDASHSHRNGNLHPVYDRMYDGLHFSGNQVIRLASEIDRYARDILKVNRDGQEVSILTILTGASFLNTLVRYYLNPIVSSDYPVFLVFLIIIATLGRFCRKVISSDCQHITIAKLIIVLLPYRLMISSDYPKMHKRLSDWTRVQTMLTNSTATTSSGCQWNSLPIDFENSRLHETPICLEYCLIKASLILVHIFQFIYFSESYVFELHSKCISMRSLYMIIIVLHCTLFCPTILQYRSCNLYLVPVLFSRCV